MAKVRTRQIALRIKKAMSERWRQLMSESARICSKVPSAIIHLFIHKFYEIFYAKQTRLGRHQTFAESSPGSPLLPLQTPEDLGAAKTHQPTTRRRSKKAITDANVDDIFLVASLSKHVPPERRRSANARDPPAHENTYIGSTTSE